MVRSWRTRGLQRVEHHYKAYVQKEEHHTGVGYYLQSRGSVCTLIYIFR